MENTELLQAIKGISEEIKVFKNEINQRFDKLESKVDQLEQGQKEIKEMMVKNDLVIANFAADINEYVDKKLKETEIAILSKIEEVEAVTADNCYNITLLKQKQKLA